MDTTIVLSNITYTTPQWQADKMIGYWIEKLSTEDKLKLSNYADEMRTNLTKRAKEKDISSNNMRHKTLIPSRKSLEVLLVRIALYKEITLRAEEKERK